jgi:hypothetical protein
MVWFILFAVAHRLLVDKRFFCKTFAKPIARILPKRFVVFVGPIIHNCIGITPPRAFFPAVEGGGVRHRFEFDDRYYNSNTDVRKQKKPIPSRDLPTVFSDGVATSRKTQHSVMPAHAEMANRYNQRNWRRVPTPSFLFAP